MIFSTRIKKSSDFATVSVRRDLGVHENDYIGSLSQGTPVTGEVTFSGADIWMRLSNTNFVGYWIALLYKGKVFAETLPVQQVPDNNSIAWVKDDYAWHGVSRPTYNNARGVKPKSTERDYLDGKLDFVAGLPMTVTLQGLEHTIMNNAYLQWIISLQPKLSLPDTLRQLQGMLASDRALNNFQQPDFKISGQTVIIQNTIKMPPLIMGNCHVKVLGPAVKYWGETLYPIEVIDTSKPYAHFRPETHPWLFFQPVNSARKPLFTNGIWDGTYDETLVQRFHWFQGKSVMPIHGRGSSVGYIREEMLVF